MALVFMFPGQSSRYDGMLEKIAHLHPENRALIQEASQILDWDLAHHFRSDNADAYRRNVDVQVAVFLANHLFLRTLEREGIYAEISLGLSLGEYNHLVHIGALRFEAALRLVRARGATYDQGPRGIMASVQPLALEDLEEVVQQAREADELEIVNFNSPFQHVISGGEAAVYRALNLIEEQHYAQAVIIERQVPMHSTMFRSVGDAFRGALERAPFVLPSRTYLPNRLGRCVHAPERERFVELLAEHVYSPVLWRRSIDHLRETQPDAVFVEVGPLSVLHNLLSRKWCKNRRFRTDAAERFPAHLGEVVSQLRVLQTQPFSEAGCSTN